MGAVTRVEGWELLLAEEIERVRFEPLAWGRHDCATWTFSVAARLRGHDAPDWIGRYRTERGGLRLMKKAGIERMQDIGVRILGDPRGSVLFAQRGDVVFSQGAYGICLGQETAHIGEAGLVAAPLALAELCWAV